MKLSSFGKYLIVFLVVLLSVTGLNLTIIRAADSARLITAQASPTSETTESMALYQVPSWARMIDIRTVNPNIRLDIRYATTNNFLKRKLYSVARCALRASVAQRLSRVQENVQKIGLSLKVYDCYRPLSVTKQMWAAMPDSRYVANPAKGSRHNRGAAVDLTLVDRSGKELEMPTVFDDFTEKAHRDYQGGSVQSRKNSQLLERVMAAEGFVSLSTEWWHFDSKDWEKFSLLDVPLQAIP
ncbi:M15 family metallopeptidase [Kamptonema sp. UHCC 0994]|uniref:M15 family metallopeptidase n=1 Tax=Kamptonema sp. UHCC 0994 TaxID=3031329 RepID=UPI0023B8D245|nr:M15 family metallopeptidase [Kamptonema sp. UHCC 0994]MDF0552207.1 M15 family metallopeptidase [Kamptonema sp. UHCC 0994]